MSSVGVALPATRPATAPGTKWTAFNAIAEQLDFGRRYTARTNQVPRSFEDTAVKQRALELVVAA
jgi:elongation factor P hydroxylase